MSSTAHVRCGVPATHGEERNDQTSDEHPDAKVHEVEAGEEDSIVLALAVGTDKRPALRT
jgi:hypothetical protein